MCELVGRNTVTQDFKVPDRITALTARVTGIAFNGVNTTILYSRDDAYMVRQTILRSGFAIWRVPVEEDNHSGNRRCGAIGPLATILEPIHAPDTTSKFGDSISVLQQEITADQNGFEYRRIL